MFAVARKDESLSPLCMKFADWWIYDLSAFHDSSKNLIQKKSDISFDLTPWSAVFKAYGLHLFSPIETLFPFAKDFEICYPSAKKLAKGAGRKKIEDILQIFSHLGLKKIEQLKRFSRAELQRRFGSFWASFIEGVLNPQSPWPWEPHQTPEILSCSYDFEDLCIDTELLLKEIQRSLEALGRARPHFSLQSMKLTFLLSQGNEVLTDAENQILLSFTYFPQLKKDIPWILKLTGERIAQLKFDYPISKYFIELLPAGSKRHYQLSLFENKSDAIAWNELCQKLKDQKFNAFQPTPTFSYLPEDCWKKVSADTAPLFQTHGLFRPLIQEAPTPIPAPQSALKFTERITWLDKIGLLHCRDYFIARSSRAWIWVFKNEKNEWFKQGVVE